MPRRSTKRRSPPVGPAFFALGTLLAVAFLGFSQQQIQTPAPLDVVIPFALRSATSVNLTASRGGSPGVFELHIKNGSGITFTLPPSWTLREVRGMALGGVGSEAPTVQGRTWEIKASGTASFWMSSEPRSLQIKNISTLPLEIAVRQVFIRENHVTDESFLVMQKPLQLW